MKNTTSHDMTFLFLLSCIFVDSFFLSWLCSLQYIVLCLASCVLIAALLIKAPPHPDDDEKQTQKGNSGSRQVVDLSKFLYVTYIGMVSGASFSTMGEEHFHILWRLLGGFIFVLICFFLTNLLSQKQKQRSGKQA